MQTQWRVGQRGATGFDYGVLYPLLDRLGLSGDDWEQMFDDIRLMESAALEAMTAPN